MTASFIIGMMITLVAFFLISGTLLRFASKSSDKEAELLCHNSIALRAQSALSLESSLADVEVKGVPALCKTVEKKISGDKEELMQQVADSMAKCWWMFGEGRYEEILSGGDLSLLWDVYSFNQVENQCFMCSTVLIDEDSIEGGSITPPEMKEFLLTKKYGRVNQTYIDYFQQGGGPGSVVFLVSGEGTTRESTEWDPNLYPHNAYAISFMAKNKESQSGWKGALKITGAVGGAVVIGFATGGAGWFAYGGAVALSLLGVSGINDAKSAIYGERDVSSIYIDDLRSAQNRCGSGDLAGE
ncbi:MAG TPA: hypothetical protein VJI32_07170 [Candidatus Nanoarchaeia archaeon]|nr:hypothetical protein [Candidatus Nanoarchaeia archaeon]